jgi:signal transduction histidine kinase
MLTLVNNNSTDDFEDIFYHDTSETNNEKIEYQTVRVLIVDDEPVVHKTTHLILDDFIFDNKKIEIIDAYSASEAQNLLYRDKDIAVILLDVVMETTDAGLKLVKYIRDVMHNTYIRIILRTGQPGDAPEEEVIVTYDINDYKSKTELTSIKLKTALITCIRSYEALKTIEEYNRELENKVEVRTAELQESYKKLEEQSVILEKNNSELKMLNETKNEFIGIAAHDLRNPLGVIYSITKFFTEDLSENLDVTQKELIKAVKESSEFMLNLLNELLDVSKIESGKLNLDFVKNDYIKLLEKNIKFNNEISKQKNITITAVFSDTEIEFYFDKLKVEQILNNLISNSVKYSFPDTTVKIEVFKENDFIITKVIDQGQGIPANELKNVFKPFKKTSVQATAGETSTGLGLSIVKKIVEGHKGKITVESEVGKGSVFTFSLMYKDNF